MRCYALLNTRALRAAPRRAQVARRSKMNIAITSCCTRAPAACQHSAARSAGRRRAAFRKKHGGMGGCIAHLESLKHLARCALGTSALLSRSRWLQLIHGTSASIDGMRARKHRAAGSLRAGAWRHVRAVVRAKKAPAPQLCLCAALPAAL